MGGGGGLKSRNRGSRYNASRSNKHFLICQKRRLIIMKVPCSEADQLMSQGCQKTVWTIPFRTRTPVRRGIGPK